MMQRPPPASVEWAWFLDVDGTLAPIAATPDAAQIDEPTRQLLRTLRERTRGAVALVSGRPIARVDELVGESGFAIAGQHGTERRDAHGTVVHEAERDATIDSMAAELREFARHHAGVIVEDKGVSLAVHYRGVPELESQVVHAVTSAHARWGAHYELQAGKKLIEVVRAGVNKGNAVKAFLTRAPFRGRTPLMIGDDVTDESAFRVVNELNGHSVKVGAGPTAAQYRLDDVADVRVWLSRILDPPGTNGDHA